MGLAINNILPFVDLAIVPDMDLSRVVGWELFLVFVGALLRHECWYALEQILATQIYVPNPPSLQAGARMVGWQHLWTKPDIADHVALVYSRWSAGSASTFRRGPTSSAPSYS